MANGSTVEKFTAYDKQMLIEDHTKLKSVQFELSEHKHDDKDVHESFDKKLDKHARILYMMIGGLAVLEVLLKFLVHT